MSCSRGVEFFKLAWLARARGCPPRDWLACLPQGNVHRAPLVALLFLSLLGSGEKKPHLRFYYCIQNGLTFWSSLVGGVRGTERRLNRVCVHIYHTTAEQYVCTCTDILSLQLRHAALLCAACMSSHNQLFWDLVQESRKDNMIWRCWSLCVCLAWDDGEPELVNSIHTRGRNQETTNALSKMRRARAAAALQLVSFVVSFLHSRSMTSAPKLLGA